MAEQDRRYDDRGRDAEEDRFRRGLDEQARRGRYGADDRAGYGGHGYSEAYGDYGRSFERDRGADRAYGAAYGIDEASYDDPRYGGRWGAGPEGSPPSRQAHPHHAHDRTWMERAGERVASWFGGEAGRSHRGRGPKNYARSDERIREDVNDRLTDDPWVDASEIEVQVASGEVTLSGAVNRREDRRRAEDIAEQVLGVRHVQNNIRVQPPARDEPLPVPMV